jgi:hypothetical protein
VAESCRGLGSLTSKKTAAILTIIGGVFYIIGGATVAGLVGLVGTLGSVPGGGSAGVCQFVAPFPCNSNSTISGLGSGFGSFNTAGIADILLAIGLVTGGLIVFGGVLINSESPGRRKIGCIVAIIMIVIGGLTTLGGLLIGFILAAIGVYLGLTFRAGGRPIVVGLGPIGSMTLGSPGFGSSANVPAGTGPLSYCIKCGSQLREGSVFCGACGARIGD